MRNRKTNRRVIKRLALAMAFCVPASLGFVQLSAAGPLGIGAQVGAGAQAGARMSAPVGLPSSHAGTVRVVGDAVPRVSERATENANGRFIEERSFGRERAAKRRNAQADAHANAKADAEATAGADTGRRASRVSVQYEAGAQAGASAARGGRGADR